MTVILSAFSTPSSQKRPVWARDYNFQLPVCNNFSRKSPIILSLFDLNRFLVVCSSSSSSMFSRLPVFKIFYACSSVYFTFSTITVPLLLTHDLHVRMLRVVQ